MKYNSKDFFKQQRRDRWQPTLEELDNAMLKVAAVLFAGLTLALFLTVIYFA